MTWLEDAGQTLAGGRLEVCYAGHERHRRQIVPTEFGPLEVFDADHYPPVGGYCTGNDVISRTLAETGTWEPHNLAGLRTVGVLEDAQPNEVVLDFGCHVGWYTRLALASGFSVLAVDGEVEHLEMTETNCARPAERYDLDLVLSRGWMDEPTRTLEAPSDGTRVRLVKVDVESAERHVVRAVGPLLAAGLIDYLLVEVSPVFRDDYEATVLGPLRYHGYERAYRLQPPEQVRRWDWILDFPQEEILFARP